MATESIFGYTDMGQMAIRPSIEKYFPTLLILGDELSVEAHLRKF